MALRVLYLQRSLSMNGRGCLSGRTLFTAFRERSDESLLGHFVVSDEDASTYSDPAFGSDVVTETLVRRLEPTVVYLEGGLLASETMWRVPRELLETLAGSGAIVIVADVDVNELRQHAGLYRDAAGFLQAAASYYPDSDEPVEYSDDMSCWGGSRQIICRYDQMAAVSGWLRPIYEDVPEILVGLPVRLDTFRDLAACGNESSTKRLAKDLGFPFLEPDNMPFASVARSGLGYVTLIAGLVSGDAWLEGCPHNTRWLLNLAEFLVEDVAARRREVESPLTSRHLVFLSHRSSDKPIVDAVNTALRRQWRLGTWMDSSDMIPSDGLTPGIGEGLEGMTHFVLFWSEACGNSDWVVNTELPAALRRQAAGTPLLIVRTDGTPVPPGVADVLRIEADGMTPTEIAAALASAIERLERRHRIADIAGAGLVSSSLQHPPSSEQRRFDS